jgi:hypothetical protein
MTGRCAECRHWVERLTDRPEPGGGARYCVRIVADADSVETRIDARYDSGFGYTSDAFLITPPSFGCVLFQAKEPT